MPESIEIKKNIEVNHSGKTELTETEAIWKSLGEYYLILVKRWYLIVAFCIIGGIIGFFKVSGIPLKYIAEVKFASSVDDNSGGYSMLAQQFGLASNTSSAFSGDNLISLIKTPSLVKLALMTTVTIRQKPTMLIDYYLDSKKIREDWVKSKSPVANITFSKDLEKNTLQQDSVLKVLVNNISSSINVSKADKDLAFITVHIEDEDPLWAKYFSEALVKTVTDYYVTLTTAKVAENVRIFQSEVDSFNRSYNKSLSSIASTQDINVNPTKQMANVPVQRQQINMNLNNIVYSEMLKNLELSKIQLQKQTPFIQIIETPKFPLDTTQPSIKKTVVIGLIAGAFLGIILIVIFKESIAIYKKLTHFGKLSYKA